MSNGKRNNSKSNGIKPIVKQVKKRNHIKSNGKNDTIVSQMKITQKLVKWKKKPYKVKWNKN